MQIQALVVIKIDILKGCKMNIDFKKYIQKCHQEWGRQSKGYPGSLLLPLQLILLIQMAHSFLEYLMHRNSANT